LTDRWALQIEYDGAGFQGWQSQRPGNPSVQDAVEAALSKVADHALRVFCAGRTDSGVHATSQIIHFETPSDRPVRAWIQGVNAHLPDSVAVRQAKKVSADFHARFSAVARRYLYVILNEPVRRGLHQDSYTRARSPLDEGLMYAAAQHLLGEHDFSSFRSSQCQSRTPMRNLMRLDVFRQADMVCLDVTANAFLHHMVRNLAGVLMDIGAGIKPVDWTAELLALKDRSAGGVTAPPKGLYLIDVSYPATFDLQWGPVLPPGMQLSLAP